MLTVEQLAILERTQHYLTVNPQADRPGWFDVSLNGHGVNWSFEEVEADNVQHNIDRLIDNLGRLWK